LVPCSSRIKVWKKNLNFGKFFGWIGQVRRTFSAVTFYDCFEHNLLTVSLIDPIFSFAGFIICLDHVSIVRKRFHYLLAQRLPGVLISGYRVILEKNFIQPPFTPPPSGGPLGPSIGIRVG
jgi:hypothetical protein